MNFHLLASLLVVVVVTSSTLAQKPTTSTPKPSTTTPKSSTTTPKPSSTTPKPSSTTPKPTTTTPKPTTTASTAAPTTTPKDALNTYNLTKDNVNCVLMKARIDLTIKYETKDGQKSQSVSVPKDFGVDGSCGKENNTLVISFFKDWELEFVFMKDSTTNYHVSSIALAYRLDEHFPDASDKGAPRTTTISTSKSYMKGNENGYICVNEVVKSDKNDTVTIKTEDLKYKAFNTKGDIDFEKTGLECSADEDTNSIVPIAVGAALAGLVVIVLIAYLIGRKRTRKTGYESV